MAKERRDSKNRLLGKGEYQKADGRYMYRYTDTQGNAGFVYSWTLAKTDRTPKGKPSGPCLRDLEKEIAKDIQDGIDTFLSQKTTINDYFDKYIEQKRIKASTLNLYRKTYDVYLRDRIGNMKLSSVKFSDVKKCYNQIIDECDIAVSTLGNVNAVLKPVFKLAIRDGLIRYNPADDVLREITNERGGKKNKKMALTVEQQKAFLGYLDSSDVYGKWKNFFTVMLATGCRVGELCGLTWSDCDFNNNEIQINRTLCHFPDETNKYKLVIQTPKSDSGYRKIPMFSEVKEALLAERRKQLKYGMCVDTIDGIYGFVFCSRNRNVLIPRNINSAIGRIVSAYNAQEIIDSEIEHRDPVLLPKFSPHILRHTFCTRLCESGMNLKVVQEVMGHSKITMTLDVYNSITDDFRMSEFMTVDGLFKIG